MTIRTAAVAALVVNVVLGMISNLTFLAAFQFRFDWLLLDPAQLIEGGPASAELLRWAAFSDLLSYYLPMAVVAMALRLSLRDRSPALVDAATLAALGYVLAGGIGAVALASAGPMLLHAHAAPGADQAAIATAFALLIEVVWRGIWQLLDAILIGAWLLSIGFVMRDLQPGFARLTIAIGAAAWIAGAWYLLGLGLARDAMLGVVFGLWAVWSVWLAILLARRRPPFEALDS